MTTDSSSLTDEANLKTAQDKLTIFISQLQQELNLADRDVVWLLESESMNRYRALTKSPSKL